MVEAHGLSDAGPVRKMNEDSFIIDIALQLFVVADGMGGHSAGEVASSLAVDTIAGFIRRTEGDGEVSWPYGIEPSLSFSGNRLRTAARSILEDPVVRGRTLFFAREGRLAPGVLVELLHYAYGKPKDAAELTVRVARMIRIIPPREALP